MRFLTKELKKHFSANSKEEATSSTFATLEKVKEMPEKMKTEIEKMRIDQTRFQAKIQELQMDLKRCFYIHQRILLALHLKLNRVNLTDIVS